MRLPGVEERKQGLACEAGATGHSFSRNGSDGMELIMGSNSRETVAGTQFPGTGYFRTPTGPRAKARDAQGSQGEIFVPFLMHDSLVNQFRALGTLYLES